jgi:hypothetical protein
MTNRTVMLLCVLSPLFILPGAQVVNAGERGAQQPVVSVTVGVGNALGWTGLQAERYLAEGRASAFAGLGYVIGSGPDGELPTGVSFRWRAQSS